MIDNNQNFSYHIFMFPFRWDYLPKNKNNINNVSFNRRTSLCEFHKLFKVLPGLKERNIFKFENELDYNEYTYFYDFARHAIYDDSNEIKDSNILTHYVFKLGNNPQYNIYLQDDEHYTLEIEEISLNVYNTGVGILRFQLKNNKYPELEDILKINECGRRLYPQFLAKQNGDRTSKTKNNFLASQIEIILDNKNIDTIIENFVEFNNPNIDELRIKPKYIPEFILKLLV